ncbi:hypothetical protein [Natronorarus salvus]|uniref:hypothetical protein n=1 Tax=Natronorarus salvus TaxID=3117733 RepID=UPI002F2651C9
MPTCEYCGESVEDDETLLSHLATDHEGELGPIDRRRVDERPPATGDAPTILYVAIVAVGLLALVLIALALGLTF